MKMRHLLLATSLVMAVAAAAQQPELIGQERWPDGTLRASRYAEGGRLHFIKYHENGMVMESGCFKNGRREGLWRQFNDQGLLIVQASFRNGLRTGVWEFRGADDMVIGRLTYKNGDIERGELFDDQGTMTAHRTY